MASQMLFAYVRLAVVTFAVLHAFSCDGEFRMNKRTQKNWDKTVAIAKKTADSVGKVATHAATKAIKEANKEVDEAEIPTNAVGQKATVNLACKAVDAAGHPLAVADENRWKANARCR